MSGIVFAPAAEALFRLGGPTAVSAGAGSGKTTALVELCVRLLAGDATGTPCDPAAIAAITFTEKAAEELVERLRGAVSDRCSSSAAPPPAEAGGGRERGGAAQAWLDRLHGLDRMAAGTIHAFCGRLLREHAPEAGLDPEFAVVDEERAWGWLHAEARAAVVAALDAGRPAARLLTAGLGAASRGGLAGLVAELVRARATRGDAGPPPIAPSDPEALRDAWERLGAAAGDLLALALARAGGSAGAARLLEQVAREWVAVEAAARGAGAGGNTPARLDALVEATHGPRLGRADDRLREARDALRSLAGEVSRLEAERLAGDQKEELAKLVADAEAGYAARKRAARAVDFDDLLVLARDLLARDRALRTELRGRYRALLVDEYQDVNALQQQLFDLLAGRGEAPPGEGPILVAVGDLKQSIYRFRGADVAVFARLVRRFAAGEGRVLHLSENHRSTPAVLELVNEVSASAMVPPAGAPPRDDELRFGEADRLLARRPDAGRPACEILVDHGTGSAAERRLREANAIVERIRALVSGAAGVSVRERGEVERRPGFGDVALLFRRLTQIGPYERALRAAGIPYRLARGGGFYQAPEVRDLGELVATLFEPQDALAWAAVLRSPMCAISESALVLLAREGLARVGRTTTTTPSPPGIAPREWARLLRFLEVWRELRGVRDRLPLAELLRRAISALDLDAALLAAPDGERRAVNLEKAVRLAARFEEDGGRAPELPRHLRALAARPPREPEAELEAGDAVAILSVHQAKGLEWPVVFVPDLGAAGRNDGRRALVDGDGRLCALWYDAAREAHVETASIRRAREAERRAAAAESRRLLYVALTRARDRLVLSGEAARGESWRSLVEAAVEARPDLVLRIPLGEAGRFPGGATLPQRPPPSPCLSRRPDPPALRLAAPPKVAAVRVAVTDLAEYARCPRRHHLGRFLRIPEPRGAGGGAHDDPGRATVRGTLAHAMLAESDLAAPPLERRAQVEAAAARRGFDPRSPGVRRIVAEVSRFVESAAGRALARAARDGRLSREVPFLLRLDGAGGAAYLVGAVDALVAGTRGEGVLVLDYKYAAPRADAAARYRLQLLAYSLAARRAYPGARVRARLQFLRGDFRALDVDLAEGDLERFAEQAPALALAAHAGEGGELPPAALGRDEARCRAEGCGYVARCYPAGPARRRPDG